MKTKIFLLTSFLFAFFTPTLALASTFVSGTLAFNTTWTAENSPYIISYTVIPFGVTLTVEEGTIVKFSDPNATLEVNGNFVVRGTETNPAYFTSINDSTVGGNTGNGTPQRNDWGNVMVKEGGTANIDHVIIRYGGYTGWLTSTVPSNLYNQGGTLTIKNSTISRSVSGITHVSGTTTLERNTLSENSQGVYAYGNGNISFIQNAFSNNTASGAYLDLSSGIAFTHSGNTATGGNQSGFYLRGVMNADYAFGKDTMPYIVGYLEIPAGKTATIRPGAVFKFEGVGSQMRILGKLNTEGTQTDPIYFTSVKDDTVLGDTNGDRNATSPLPADWAEIVIADGGEANFDHSIIRYGGYTGWLIGSSNSEITNQGGTLDIANSEIARGNIGVYHGWGTTTISYSSIRDNASAGVYNNSPQILRAENNWWGGTNGPYHQFLNVGGIGNNQVSNNIDFIPWLGYDPTIAAPLTLTNPTETEDDNNQDSKGVADKTNFTFGISYTGATAPSDVTLWTNDGTATKSYPLSHRLDLWEVTSTFPKGHYGYHFEANGGAQRFPTTGELEFTTGYSNVAFLPGLEASRLYRTATDPADPSVTKVRLWEPPLVLQDNSQLFLNASGTPERGDIFTEDVVDEVDQFLGANIYEGFIDSMNTLVTDKTIQAWKPLPYDWRFDVRDIVNHPIALEAGSYSMTEEIQKLAESSDTGKVTIIGHSNGGLVAKVLANKLDANLLDQMIFVASPQAGTPQAVGAILHGYNQGIPKDWLPLLINTKEARDLAVNMPSAYGLLPSAQYFTYVDDPVITFDSDPLLTDWRAKYGIEIHSAETLHNFLVDQTRAPMPVTEETKNPIIGNETLLNSAEVLHDSVLDDWMTPPGVTLTQIAGWGEDTLSKIVYYQGIKTSCSNPHDIDTCASVPALEYKMKTVLDGDGTVVVPSALWTSGAGRYWVDLQKYNNDHPISVPLGHQHADILEVQELRDFVKNIIVRNNIIPDNYVTTSAPAGDESKRLHFTLHSPLTLDLYDSAGNHTGISTTTGALEENIPGSRYKTFGELKYISAPASTTFTLVMNGYAAGSFTMDMEEFSGDTLTASTTFAGVPSSTTTVATLTIPDGNIANSSPLQVDENGDGAIDFSLIPKAGGVTVPDFTPPEVVISFNTTTNDVLIVGTDTGGTATTVTTATSTTITDEAGNTFIIPFIKYKEKPTKLKLVFDTLIYNGIVTNTPKTTLEYEWEMKNETLKELKQDVRIKNTRRVSAEYEAKKKETKITDRVKEYGEKSTQKITKQGIVPVVLSTHGGGIEVSY